MNPSQETCLESKTAFVDKAGLRWDDGKSALHSADFFIFNHIYSLPGGGLMKAVYLENAVKLVTEEVSMPDCGDDEAVVRVEACGICRTDMKCYFQGQRDLKMPRILGHEIAGIVLAAGKNVTGIEPGSHVQVYPGLSCGSCRYCRQGFDNLCEHLAIMGFNHDGGFSAYLKIPAKSLQAGGLNQIPGGLSLTEATMTEPLACCINMLEAVEIRAGDNLLIFGAGRFGLLIAMLARLKGAGRIMLTEPDPRRRTAARELGFDLCFDPHDPHLKERISCCSGNQGVDLAITCTPLPDALTRAMQLLNKKGRLGFFSGLVGPESSKNADLNLIHYKELTVKGAYGCSLRHNRAALALLGAGAIDAGKLITREISINELREGLLMVKNQAELSVVVTQFE